MNPDELLDKLDISDLQGALTEEEKEVVRAILAEISAKGSSATLDNIWYSDYEEIPVDIYTFITDKRYLGESFLDNDGKLLIYSFWVEVLKTIFAPTSQIFECIGGNTLVRTLDGRDITMEDLCKEIEASPIGIGVYSFDKDNHSLVPAVATKAKCNGIRPIYRVTLDNGKYFDCTSNHKILVRDNYYQSIDEGLKVGDTLMPFSYYLTEEDSELISNHLLRMDSIDLSIYKIKSIDYLKDDLVYDIEVPVYHNFCLSSGAIVHNCGLSGAIGLGKSTIATIGLAYILYKLLCLKDPASYYRLTKGSKVAIAIFNITLDQGYGVGFAKLQAMLKQSEWFLQHGNLTGLKTTTYHPGKNIEILVGAKMEHFIGRDIFAGFLDEMEFAPGADAKMEQSKIMKLYTTIKRRMESRYMKLGQLPGMLFLVSSKKSDSDFLEQYLKRNKDKPYLYIVDEPIWVVKADQGKYSGKTFKVAIGNTYLKSKILADNESAEPYVSNGQEVIDVPVEHRDAFELDINSALMDIAGKALSSSLKYIYYDKLKNCYRSYLKNPFTMNEITLGFDDEVEIKDFLVHKYLSKVDRTKPHFIHWDASKSGDATGLAMSTIAGTAEVKKLINGEVFQQEDIIHKLVFALRIKASPGSEIPFYKIRNFIYYMKFELGYNIISVTCDSYQSVDSLQQLKLRGFLTATLSMDRSRAPYDTMKNAINEGRFILPHIPELEKEFLELEEDKVVNKIDHPRDGSKDIADAVTGTVYRSLDYKNLVANYNAQSDAQILIQTNNGVNSGSSSWVLGANQRVYD